jgi:dipeptidyl aminopeptidase/acylaminoacyl peptidase
MSRSLFATLAFLGTLLYGRALASSPPPLSPDVYGRLPNISEVTLSPSGELYAYINTTNGKRQLLVKDLAGRVKVVAPIGDDKVRALEWAGDDHVILTASYTFAEVDGNDERAESVVVNVDTAKNFIVFVNCVEVEHRNYGTVGFGQSHGRWSGYFVGLTTRPSAGSSYDLYRVDLNTGACEIAAHGLAYGAGWAIDGAGTVVAHAGYLERTGDWTLRTGVEGGAVLAHLQDKLAEIALEGLGRTPDTVLVDKAIPEEWSLKDGSHKVIDTDSLVNSFLHDPSSGLLVGALLAGDQPREQFFNPTLKARQAAIKKALGGEPYITSWSADFRKLVVYTEGDADAGTYWLIDGGSAKPLGYSYPDIPDAAVGPSRIVVYKAADGLEIHGVLTLPPGRSPKDLPLVVIPHGGPQSHDSLGFDWQAQAFANHGYAVFQPNFRGSDGYGLAFRNAGFGQWGRKMQTDISDGVAELARQGVIDPKRACIFGGSYGGYAALAGVTVQQGLYRCAVSYSGVTDLHSMFAFVYPPWFDGQSAGSRYMRKFFGVEFLDDPVLRKYSPAKLADHADAPILLIYGEDDSVVPVDQSLEMERALRAAGKPVEILSIKGEDHWLSKDATRKQVLGAALAFVQKYNPPD